MQILAIDPGNIESGWVIFDTGYHKVSGPAFKIIDLGKCHNEDLIDKLTYDFYNNQILVMEEMVAYGKCGREVTDTSFWAGRMCQASSAEFGLITRSKVRGHFKTRTDAGIIEKLIERFCPELYVRFGSKELSRPKLINAARDEYFKNFKSDIWQAFALGVCWYDLNVH